jgi:hypothetical protein
LPDDAPEKEMPELDNTQAQLLQILFDVGPVGASFGGATTVSWVECMAYANLTNAFMSASDWLLIRRLSGVYASALHSMPDEGFPPFNGRRFFEDDDQEQKHLFESLSSTIKGFVNA